MRLLLLLSCLSLQAANTYYVANSGSDMSDGSSGSPWKTIAHALDKTVVGTMRCGDTLIVDATSAPAGNATFPYFADCGSTTTIQSSRLSRFLPPGYRTNPVRDTGNYGKMTFVTGTNGLGWNMEEETRGQNQAYLSFCNFTLASDTFTSNCSYGTWNLTNGSKVVFDSDEVYPFPVVNAPSPLAFSTHYYVVNSSCALAPGSLCPNGTTFQLSATSGGSPITGLTCDASCIARVIFWEPVAANISTSTLTVPEVFSANVVDGTPVTLVSSGHTFIGTLPAPLLVDTIYYIVNLSGINFQLAATPGGSPITLTTPGTSVVSIASIQVPNQWAFRGLEFSLNSGSFSYGMLAIGRAGWTSEIGAISHIEVDRCYIHGNDDIGEDTMVRSVVENGRFVYIHDSYFSGNTASESQAINGAGSPGPVAIKNNFLEASGEVTLYGGATPTAPAANTDHLFTGNYFYKPPKWKVTSNTGAASGACLYDTTDPLRPGGEFYTDTMTGTKYICGSNGMWGTTGTSAPSTKQIKNCWEHKNGRRFSLVGNLLNFCFTRDQFMAINLSQEEGSGTNMADDHILVQNNALFNFYQFSSRRSDCDVTANVHCIHLPSHHAFINNLAVHNPASCGVLFTVGDQNVNCNSHSNAFQGFWGPQTAASLLQGDMWDHNTIFVPDSTPWIGYTPMFTSQLLGGDCFTFTPTINYETRTNGIDVGDFSGDCGGTGGNIIMRYHSNLSGANNALKGANSSGYGTVTGTNSWLLTEYPADNTVIKYVNATGDMSGDYHLATDSPYSASNMSAVRLSTDGTDLGADVDLVNMATSGAAAGTPPWDQMYNVRWSVIGSTKAVLSYTAPTGAACTGTIYNSIVRITGNEVVSVADSAASSISDGLRRELLFTGLTASTTYPAWKLSCANGVLIIGFSFTTRAAGSTLQFPFQMSSATALTYSANKNLSSGTTLSAATTQYVPVATNATVYSQFTGGQLHVSVAP